MEPETQPSLKNDPLTKKQRKELKRKEKHERIEHAKQRTARMRMIKWGGIIVVIVLVVIVLIKTSSNNGAFPKASLKEGITAQDWTKGASTAPVTLIEYSDFQCPACGTYYPLIKRLTAEFQNDIHFAYRHFPLRTIHKNADLAAQAAEAAGNQGKFWEMHDRIFETQSEWSSLSKDDAKKFFMDIAQQLSLAGDDFAHDIENATIEDKIESHYQSGLAASVDATPTFFLNSKKLTSNPRIYDEFVSLVNDAKNKNTGL